MAINPRGKKRWRVRLCHRGRRHEWIIRGSKADAEGFESRKRLELEASDPTEVLRTAPTFLDFCVLRYRPHAELHLRKSSWYGQGFMLATLMEHFGDQRLTEIRDEDVEAYARDRLGAGLNSVSVNNELRVLRRVRNFARERKVPLAEFRVEMLEEGERRPRSWSRREVLKLIGACRQVSPEILPLVVFLTNTGCRKGEAMALRWDHVDLAKREVRIWPSEEWRPKNGKPREVPISNALLPWLSGPRRSRVWVFPSSKLEPGELEAAKAANRPPDLKERFKFWPKLQFNRACVRARLTGGPHRLRHTFASWFLEAQPDLGLLAVVLGHSDEAVTRLYAHMLPDRLARARNVVSMGPAFGPATVTAEQRWGRLRVVNGEKMGPEVGLKTGAVGGG